MNVRDVMSGEVLTVGPAHTLRQAAKMMADRRVGSVVVIDPDSEGVGIMTERDVLYAIGAGLDPDTAQTAEHITWDVVYASPQWTVQQAAEAMVTGGFRHLVVLDADKVLGVVSIRDVLRHLVT